MSGPTKKNNLWAWFAFSFGLAVGAGAGSTTIVPLDERIINTLSSGALGGLMCGLTVLVFQRFTSRNFALTDLFAVTLLFAVVLASFFHWKGRKTTLSFLNPGNSAGGAITADSPAIRSLAEQRRITVSCFDSAIRELRLRGIDQDLSYSVSTQTDSGPEAWRITFEVSRETRETTTLIIRTQVSGSGNADTGVIQPVEIRSKLHTDESNLLNSKLEEAYEAHDWLHKIVQIPQEEVELAHP